MNASTTKVLVVDDVADIATIAARHLAGAGYRVYVECEAEGALRTAERETPDCIMLDIMMPGMDGFEVMARLRRNAATAAIPVVLVSARVTSSGVPGADGKGAAYCIQKPFRRHEIVSAVGFVLGNDASGGPLLLNARG